jgi:phosphoribosylglycinamide formyltransferase-1
MNADLPPRDDDHHPGGEFVCEPLTPSRGRFDRAGMARGEPGVPLEFSWRGRCWRLAEVLEQWKSTGPCTHGSRERYVRRHWYRVRVEPAAKLTIYCDRQARRGSSAKARWWVFSAETEAEGPEPTAES